MRKYRPILFGAIVCIVTLLCTFALVLKRYQTHKELEKRSLINEALNAKNRLENCLYHAISPAQTLRFIIEHYGVPEDFNATGNALIMSNHCVSTIQILEKGIVTHVYPQKGNEVVLGYNILSDPNRNREAYKAITAKDVFFAGPLKLKQGGVGIIGRVPYFLKNQFAGFTAIIIKIETLIKTAQLENTKKSNFNYQLSKINPNTGLIEVFVGEKNIRNNAEVTLNLPLGNWVLKVASKTPVSTQYFIHSILIGILVAILGGLTTIFLLTLPKKLELKVLERTKQLREKEGTLQIHLQKIEKQNSKLMEIAWIQSHKVRGPLARIMGLVNIYRLTDGETERQQVINHLDVSAQELDSVIHQITKLSEELKDPDIN
ncbi:MAG: multi-sensor signal transduction histidine kinase [Bacteroidota bacterium]|nr:multi-sensor signal transduction histidine kinase [Bacteroidota bacterium]